MKNKKNKIIIVIQARVDSERLHGKVLMKLGSLTILDWVHRSASQINYVDRIIIATSNEKVDKPIVDLCKKNKYEYYCGDKNDVLRRIYNAVKRYKPLIVIRITADCPFIDPNLCNQLLLLFKTEKADYAQIPSNLSVSWPDGLDCEVMKFETLKIAFNKAKLPSDREHVTKWIRRNDLRFKNVYLPCPYKNISKFRWALDNLEDYKLMKKIVKFFSDKKPLNFIDLIEYFKKNSIKLKTKKQYHRGREIKMKKIIKEIKNDFKSKIFSQKTFLNTNKLFKVSKRIIPLGSQTFSKSYINWPKRKSPLFLTHGNGGRVFDVDGNEYVDLVGGLAPIILGYCDPEVDHAIKLQLNKGIIFSLANELEIKLSKKLIKHIPCAEQVRFGKNGSDATSAAIRLARYYTKKNRIAVCGYHGWHDWFIGSTYRNKGVPESVQKLTHSFKYNSIEDLEKLFKEYPNEIAAVIMEPMTSEMPKKNYLNEIKKMTHRNKAILIFDEVITGFRYSIGGAQKYFNIKPDLACFGKSIGNGMPISFVTGKKEIMKGMEEIFFSGTFYGETLSLAACLAVIEKMEQFPVLNHVWNFGKELKNRVNLLINKNNLNKTLKLKGKDPWVLLEFFDRNKFNKFDIITFFKKNMIQNGVLISGSHNVCYAHNDLDMDVILNAYDYTLSKLKKSINNNTLKSEIKDCDTIKPIFQIR